MISVDLTNNMSVSVHVIADASTGHLDSSVNAGGSLSVALASASRSRLTADNKGADGSGTIDATVSNDAGVAASVKINGVSATIGAGSSINVQSQPEPRNAQQQKLTVEIA